MLKAVGAPSSGCRRRSSTPLMKADLISPAPSPIEHRAELWALVLGKFQGYVGSERIVPLCGNLFHFAIESVDPPPFGSFDARVCEHQRVRIESQGHSRYSKNHTPTVMIVTCCNQAISLRTPGPKFRPTPPKMELLMLRDCPNLVVRFCFWSGFFS